MKLRVKLEIAFTILLMVALVVALGTPVYALVGSGTELTNGEATVLEVDEEQTYDASKLGESETQQATGAEQEANAAEGTGLVVSQLSNIETLDSESTRTLDVIAVTPISARVNIFTVQFFVDWFFIAIVMLALRVAWEIKRHRPVKKAREATSYIVSGSDVITMRVDRKI